MNNHVINENNRLQPWVKKKGSDKRLTPGLLSPHWPPTDPLQKSFGGGQYFTEESVGGQQTGGQSFVGTPPKMTRLHVLYADSHKQEH